MAKCSFCRYTAITCCENNCSALMCLTHTAKHKIFQYGTATASVSDGNDSIIRSSNAGFVSAVEKKYLCPDCLIDFNFKTDHIDPIVQFQGCDKRVINYGMQCCFFCWLCLGWGIPCWCHHLIQKKYIYIYDAYKLSIREFRKIHLTQHQHSFYISRFKMFLEFKMSQTICLWSYNIPQLKEDNEPIQQSMN